MGKAKYSNENDWESMVGERIEKISGKPFKSGMHTDYAISIEINPNTNKRAFRMLDCNSLVDCHMCKIAIK